MAASINPSRGFSVMAVTVEEVAPNGMALCVDQTGRNVQVSSTLMTAKGQLPQIGELWLIDKTQTGYWMFSAILKFSQIGSTITSSTGTPDDYTFTYPPKQGDIYYQVDASSYADTVWYFDGTAWANSVTTGPTGPMGPTGPTGPQGPALAGLVDVTLTSGVDKTGVTDSSTGIQNAINAIMTAGGGTLYFPPGTYKIAAQLTIPVTSTATSNAISASVNPTHDGTTIFQSNPLRITGAGASATPRGDTPIGGTILNFTTGSAAFQITALGEGTLEIDHIVLMDSSTGANYFILVTNTVLHLHDYVAIGNTLSVYNSGTHTQTSFSITDLVMWGGNGFFNGTVFLPYPSGAAVGCFQGYGSTVERGGHVGIRHAGYFNTAANAIYYDKIAMWNGCGSGTSEPTPFMLQPAAAQSIGGITLMNVDIEMDNGYQYGVMCQDVAGATFTNFSIFDSVTGVAGVYFDSNCSDNTMSYAYLTPGLPDIQDATNGKNNIINGANSRLTGAVYTTASSQSTASTSYVTTGVSVTCITGCHAKVTLSGALFNATGGELAIVAVGVSGATTLAPADALSLNYLSPSANESMAASVVNYLSVTQGTNVFTIWIRCNGGTANFVNGSILVEPLP